MKNETHHSKIYHGIQEIKALVKIIDSLLKIRNKVLKLNTCNRLLIEKEGK